MLYVNIRSNPLAAVTLKHKIHLNNSYFALTFFAQGFQVDPHGIAIVQDRRFGPHRSNRLLSHLVYRFPTCNTCKLQGMTT